MTSRLRISICAALLPMATCHAEQPSKGKTEWKSNGDLVLTAIRREDFVLYRFFYKNQEIYKIHCKGLMMERYYNSSSSDGVIVQEHDIDEDGQVDGIRVGLGDDVFTPYKVSFVKREGIVIEPFPENWIREVADSGFLYDNFISYLKKPKK